MVYGMDNIVTMDKAGRLVLPRSIRKALHVREPAAFKAEVVGNRVELTPVAFKRELIKRRKGLLIVCTGGEKFDAADAIRAMRDERL